MKFNTQDLISYIDENLQLSIDANEKEIAEDIIDCIKNNRSEKLKFYENFIQHDDIVNIDFRKLLMNIYTYNVSSARGYDIGFNFDEYGWIIINDVEIVKVIEFKDKKKSNQRNKIEVGKFPNNTFSYGLSYSTGAAGGGFKVCIYCQVFNSEEECIDDAINNITKYFKDAIESSKTDSCGNYKMPFCKEVLDDILSFKKPKVKQLEMFF